LLHSAVAWTRNECPEQKKRSFTCRAHPNKERKIALDFVTLRSSATTAC
jgi:hypothetical protein